MTSSELVGYVQRDHFFAEKRISISKDRVYLAGSWSQNEICTELRPLEGKCNLTLISGQERYQFPVQDISGATATSPIILTIPAHPFNTGDTVVVSSVLGLTGANARWSVTKPDANHISLDGSTGTGTYTASTGKAYHGILAAIDTKLIRKTGTYSGRLHKKTVQEVESDRWQYGTAGSPADEVSKHYVIYENPIVIGVRGIPLETITTEVLYLRKPLPSEKLSATVNPFLPDELDKLLYRGTLLQALELLNLEGTDPALATARTLYEEEKNRQRGIQNSQKYVPREETQSLIW